MKKIYLLAVLWLLFALGADAQDTTKSNNKAMVKIKYEQATTAYDVGDLDKSTDLLQEIIYSKQLMKAATKQQKADIMRLGAMTSLYIKELDKADMYIKEILKYQPEYKIENINNADLTTIKIKLDKLYATPKLSVGIGVGTNTTRVNDTKSYSLMEYNIYDGKIYKNTVGASSYFAGFEYTLIPLLSVTGGIKYSTNEYEYILPQISDERISTQTLNYIQIPVNLRFNVLPERKICPYFQAGVAVKYLSSAERSVSSTKTPMDDFYKNTDYGVSAGGGIKFHLNSYIIICADMSYYQGLQQINKSDNRFVAGPPGQEFLFRYYDVMDDIKLNNISLSLSLSYAINHQVFRKTYRK